MVSIRMRGSNIPGSGAGRNPAGDALTDLILGLFRLNNLLLTSGDRLVELEIGAHQRKHDPTLEKTVRVRAISYPIPSFS